MESKHTIRAIVVASIFLNFWLPAWAQGGAKSGRDGFRVELELGVGSVERTLLDAEIDDNPFYMGFLGGYWISDRILAGIELNGWLLQSSNLRDPSVGEGISQIFIFTKFYPSTTSSWFIKAGGGYVSYWNHRPAEPTGDSGEGFELGAGYDFVIRKGDPWLISPFVTYGSGSLGPERYKAVTIGVGLSYDF